ncbi:hypothetical protein G3N95_34900 [Paraburkholderia sp. Tr-20389]|uniref:hypothetical protein n=1 Tax=Paraburkholderia sp. Tr-20389 TaxID=2703903 RepID=UPI00197FA505|nr:hypothetical protein [Paraburkholderia sp. Tr-20389]MBN3758149.1 hypothetical protein [Paraburkholderia sp. Tr-20389]
MPQTHPRQASNSAIAFINAQLLSLSVYASLLSDWIVNGEKAPDLSAAEPLLAVKSAAGRDPERSAEGAPTKHMASADVPEWPVFSNAAQRLAFATRIPSTNAIVAVADLFEVHRMSDSRAPEVQFLMRLRDAALNDNTFRLNPDEYRPRAAYGNIVIDEKLDGTLLFGDGKRTGLMELGDIVGLLRYLADMLRSVQAVVSSGDAG